MLKIKLFQISGGCEDCKMAHGESCLNKFQGLERTKNLTKKCYKKVYEFEKEETENIEKTLHEIFQKFNINHPEDFEGHSLSVSDVIEINDKAFYIESIGFTELEQFGKEVK